MIKKDFRKDYYTGLKGIYFYKIINTIISIGNLKRPSIKILDFGSGVSKLKNILGKNKVVNFDIIPELSDVKDWRSKTYDYVVANEVFELLSPKQIRGFTRDLKKSSPNAMLIAGISLQSPINTILSILAGEPDAHDDTVTLPKDQIKILTEKMDIKHKKTVLGLCNVYLLEFKK